MSFLLFIGIFAVIGVCPSAAILCVNAVATSFIVLLNAADPTGVAVTTGLPGVYRTYVPVPVLAMMFS